MRVVAAVIALAACSSKTDAPPPAVLEKFVAVLEVKDHFEQSIVNEPIAGDLVALLAIDRGDRVELVTKPPADRAAAFEIARRTARTTHPTLKMSLMEGTPVFTNDDVDESISTTMLAPDLFQPYASQVHGDLLVAFPARARVFVTGSDDPGAAEGIAKIAYVAFQTEPHPLSTTIFKWSPTGWTVHALR
jgi:hypothetical protein